MGYKGKRIPTLYRGSMGYPCSVIRRHKGCSYWEWWAYGVLTEASARRWERLEAQGKARIEFAPNQIPLEEIPSDFRTPQRHYATSRMTSAERAAYSAALMAEARPSWQRESEQPSTSWAERLWAERQQGAYPSDTERVGKWLVYISRPFVDETWPIFKRATEKGRLGSATKIATALTFNGHSHVMCVYTYDGEDREDVVRVGRTLRELGVKQHLSYKLDSDTLAGRYASKGDKVALYSMRKGETDLRDD